MDHHHQYTPAMKSHTRHPSATTLNAMLTLAWLGTDQHAAGILATAHDLMAAEQTVRKTLPQGIAKVCRVARMDTETITLAVPAAAYASKLRQLGPRIIRALNQAGWLVSRVQVRVQGALARPDRPTRTRHVQPLDGQALQAFDALQKQLEPGPLSDAVQRLLNRHQP